MKYLLLSFLLLSTLFMTSCKKEYTTINPITTVQYTIHPNQWVATSGDYGNGFKVDIPVPEVTQATVDYGAVSVYLTTNASNTTSPDVWEAIPDVVAGYSFVALHTLGTVTIVASDPYAQNLNPDVAPFNGDIAVKIAIQNPN
ncbi:hypothetical protein [Deminuibacter soli]|uniref:DUF1735 domain-containing protein n=1 Tax=Deminuibacter soli TaxID=2291815 RepID=A0A3E1NEF9_9BACT|nr:hypothetical protein [Deminuibacter soli]RFM26366.1 hypothetical protein DXN05_20885 [Deminuibacter soli]